MKKIDQKKKRLLCGGYDYAGPEKRCQMRQHLDKPMAQQKKEKNTVNAGDKKTLFFERKIEITSFEM